MGNENISGVPQRPKRKEESRSDLETFEFRNLFFTLLAEGYDQHYIINYLTKDPEIVENVVINWFNNAHTPSDLLLRKRILSALKEFRKINPPPPKTEVLETSKTPKTPETQLPKGVKRPGLRERARANKERLEAKLKQEEEKRRERGRIKSEEEYKALEEKLKKQNKII
jgi:hypothetical protein